MTLPPDIDPESRNRLPLPRRENMDEDGRRVFDEFAHHVRSLVGLQGPTGIRLHDHRLTQFSQPLNQYLRFDAGLDDRLREIAILATAREFDQPFEWCAHESEAKKLGIAPELIDAIRYRKAVDGFAEADALMITLVREALVDHRVKPETFAHARRLLGEKALLNYVSLIGNYASTAVLLTVFDQQLPEGTSSTLS
jgi:4-carboxymuconolactone decarboxylase